MKAILIIILVSFQVFVYSQQPIKEIKKVTIVTLLESTDTAKVLFEMQTIYYVPALTDMCLESSIFYAGPGDCNYAFYINDKLAEVGGYKKLDDENPIINNVPDPLSFYTSIDKPNKLKYIGLIHVDKSDYYEQDFLFGETPNCYFNYDSDTAPIIRWEIYGQSKLDYSVEFDNENMGTPEKGNIFMKYMPGMDTTLQYYPVAHVSGITYPKTFQKGEILYRLVFRPNYVAFANETSTKLLLGEKTISVTNYVKYEIGDNIGLVFYNNIGFGTSSKNLDNDKPILKIKSIVKPINWRTNEEFDNILKESSKPNSPIYTIRYSDKFDGFNELWAYVPGLKVDDETVELEYKYTYESKESFKVRNFKTDFEFRNTVPTKFYDYHEIKVIYPKGQVFIDPNNAYCNHLEERRQLTFRYYLPADIPTDTKISYEDKDAKFFRTFRIVNPILTIVMLLILIWLLADQPIISQKEFSAKFDIWTNVISGAVVGYYLYRLLSIESNFIFEEAVKKSCGIPPMLVLLFFTYINIRLKLKSAKQS